MTSIKISKKNRILSVLLCFLLILPLSGCELDLSFLSPPPPITLEDVPDYSGEPYVVLENGIPAFTEEEMALESFETYAPLDLLGRCGEAFALVGPETMPSEERGPIGQIKPSGWHTVRYDGLVDGNYLYNRCHLIGYQLTGENDNEQNLITGTRYMNVEGMLPFENAVAEYVEETGSHVLYRVTPVFEELELLCRGVVMEAYSIEDSGDSVSFHVYVYNVQPGITIDYATGESYLTEEAPQETPLAPVSPEEVTDTITYVFNKRSMKFHLPTCESIATMSETNREDFTGTREEAIALGYAPCGQCKP